MNLPPVALHHVFVAGGPHGSQIFERNLDQEAENESTITNASDTPHNIDELDFPETSHSSSHKHADGKAAHYFKDESKSRIHLLQPDMTNLRKLFHKIL